MEIGIEKTIAHSVAEDKDTADFLDEVITATEYDVELQKLAIKSFLGIYPSLNLEAREFVKIVELIAEEKISGLIAKDIWDKIRGGNFDIEKILRSLSESKSAVNLGAIVREIIAENPEVLQDYRKGKKEAINVLIGKIIVITEKQIPIKEIIAEIHSVLQ